MPRIRAVTPNGVRTVSAPLSFRMENARKKANEQFLLVRLFLRMWGGLPGPEPVCAVSKEG